VWGGTTWEHRPPQLFGRITPWSQRLWCVWLQKAGLKDSNYDRQRSVYGRKKQDISATSTTARALYNVDNDNVGLECEGSWAIGYQEHY